VIDKADHIASFAVHVKLSFSLSIVSYCIVLYCIFYKTVLFANEIGSYFRHRTDSELDRTLSISLIRRCQLFAEYHINA